MQQIVNVLETGITLTTPLFFIIVLIAILRVLRTLDLIMASLLRVRNRLEKLEKAAAAKTRQRIEERLERNE